MAVKTQGKTRGAGKASEKAKPVQSRAKTPKNATKKTAAPAGDVLKELKQLARELSQAAKGLSKRSAAQNPKEISAILANVERITAEAATKSLMEAEAAKEAVTRALFTLSHDWSRRELEALLSAIGGHLTNIIVAQEFQDLAGQSLRKAMKAMVGAIIVVEGGGLTEVERLSQKDVDTLLNELMP